MTYKELTDDECTNFRALSLSFNDMVRAIHKSGYELAVHEKLSQLEPVGRVEYIQYGSKILERGLMYNHLQEGTDLYDLSEILK